ncbi:uncharacterized protein [Rutidosis leptorrhynchoides]|uniref:uncharacterized protein n=1 Tax=Rutidosis leptorrhynchoides TaxID=125765 RepID=UPI003A99B041
MGKNSGGKKKKGAATATRVLRSRTIGGEEELHDSDDSIKSVNKDDEANHTVMFQTVDPLTGLPINLHVYKSNDDESVSVHSADLNEVIPKHANKVLDDYEFPELIGNNNNFRSSSSSSAKVISPNGKTNPLANQSGEVPKDKIVNEEDINVNSTHASPHDSPYAGVQGSMIGSFAEALNGNSQKSNKKVNFRFIEPLSNKEEDIDVELPISSVLEVNERYSNTLYGYFLGKRIAYPVVKNYVTNVWKKFGLEKIMMNARGFFFFKFTSESGLKGVLESGPWIIRSSPIILNAWTPDVPLTKEDLTRVPVWVKIHDIPIVGFTETGLSMIASNIGIPMTLDSYTSTMCLESWGRPNFARALVEISSEKEMQETIRMAIPNINGTSKTVCSLRVEFEWKPPRCSCCVTFGHKDSHCPKSVITIDNQQVKQAKDKDGFETVGSKKSIKVPSKKQVGASGFAVQNKKQTLVYRPVKKTNEDVNRRASTSTPKTSTHELPTDGVAIKNPYEILNDLNDDDARDGERVGSPNVLEDELSDLEANVDETSIFMEQKTGGASTPGKKVSDETHVDISKLTDICSKVFPVWSWVSNMSVCSGGTRIILGWNPNVVNVMVLNMTHQVIHCLVKTLSGGIQLFVSIIYADNYYITRRQLWQDLCMHKGFVGNHPWVLMGDFNVSLDSDDSNAGSSRITIAMREFRECVEYLRMSDVNHVGLHFTWNQSPFSLNGKLKKIDRIMANDKFIEDYGNAFAIFQPYGISDHCPAILKFPTTNRARHKPFKFGNFIVYKEGFDDIVIKGWRRVVVGHKMFQVVKKLRWLKKPLRNLMWKKGNLHIRVTKLKTELDEAQTALDICPFSMELREDASCLLRAYNEAVLEEERFLKQKSKIEWLRVGDNNSSYFHKIVKGKIHRGRITAIENAQGTLVEDVAILNLFVEHFTHFLGTTTVNAGNYIPDSLFIKKLTSNQACRMIRPVVPSEVKSVIFDMGNNKSPGPDGYTAEFFKSSWDIIGDEIVDAVQDFFRNGQLLSELNHTVIVLLPKVQSPSKVNDYRPIALCNTLYKCISKIIANRIKDSLDDIISENQSAFVPGRRISDNILLTQELMRNYHLLAGSPRCAFKGDPMSPYLFTLVMEVLTLLLIRNANNECFRYHPKCDDQKIINLCFADDLFVFSHADINSVQVISSALEEFKKQILILLPFEEGSLPIKYLGVPLIASRLFYTDCKVLVDQGSMKKGKAKVKWDDVCKPKEKEESIWVRWVHSYWLRNSNFWDVSIPTNASWGCRKLLSMRDVLRGRFLHEVGNGVCTSAWFDEWSDLGPLIYVVRRRNITQAGMHLSDSVADIINNGAFIWPAEWVERFSILNNLAPPVLSNNIDIVKWRDIYDAKCDYSIQQVWEYIRPRANKVPWFSVVWFSQCIPRHAFILWLLMGERLKTRDKLKAWEIRQGDIIICSLCNLIPDSHEHTFFSCPFASQVWSLVLTHMDFPISSHNWKDFMLLVCPFAKRNIARIVIIKLLFAATVYFVWQERNRRVFKKGKQSPVQVFESIYSTVRLKLMSFRWRSTANSLRLKSDWKIS